MSYEFYLEPFMVPGIYYSVVVWLLLLDKNLNINPVG